MLRSNTSKIYRIGELSLRVMAVLVCALNIMCCPADMTSAARASFKNDLVLLRSSSNVQHYDNGIVPANISLTFTRDGNTLTAIIQMQPLEGGEFVVAANRISIGSYDRWSFISGGFHSDVLCYDSLNSIGMGPVEPFDWNRPGEEYLFGICSRERPLTISYSRVLDSNDHYTMQQWDSCRYATLDAIVGFRKEKLCGYLPEVCEQEPWIFGSVSYMRDEFGHVEYHDEISPAERVALTEVQFDRIISDYDVLMHLAGTVVSTITLPFRK